MAHLLRARLFLLSALSVVVLASNLWAADDDRERDRVLDRYVEAMGGRSRLNDIKSVTIEGRMSLADGREATVKVMKKRPNLVRTVVLLPQGVRMVNGYDGETAWQRTLTAKFDKIEEMDVGPYHPFIRDAALESPLAAEGFNKDWISYQGLTRIEGNIECHHLEIHYPNGAYVEHYLDAKTYYERKTIKHEIVDDHEEINTSFPSDFRYVDGVVFAFRVVTGDHNGERSELNLDEVRINSGILDTIFELPNRTNIYGD